MANTTTIVLASIVVLIAAAAGYVAIFGIPAAWKRELEEKALETMGENKASYMMKDAMSKIPESEQKDVDELKKGFGNAVGGSLQNPLGKFAGNAGDDTTKDLTGR